MSAESLQKKDSHGELEQFRINTRSWLESHCPPSQRDPLCQEQPVWAGRQQSFPSSDARIWFERMRDRGWTVPDWPIKYGGAGLDERQCKILDEEMARLNCRTPLQDLGIWMLGPALLEFGSDAQKREHLPPLTAEKFAGARVTASPVPALASPACNAVPKTKTIISWST